MHKGPVRIAVIGLGRAFALMLPAFRDDPRVELVAACDPRAEAREQFRRDFAGRACASTEELLAEDDAELVYVASPHQFHAQQVIACARAGRHVLVEKPMALALEDCDAMIDACAGAGVQLLVGHSHAYDTPYRRAREIISGGTLGRVRMIHAFNYTDFLYRPRRPEELDAAAGGGAVMNQAAHQVDIVSLLAGSPAVSVRAETAAWDPDRAVAGAYSALIRFENDCFATLVYSGYANFDSDEWSDWIGEMGYACDPARHARTRRAISATAMAESERKSARNYGGADWQKDAGSRPLAHQHFGHLIVCCERGDLRPLPDALCLYRDGEAQRIELPAPPVPRVEVIDEIVAALDGSRAPVHDGSRGRDSLRICLAIERSASERTEILLPPSTATSRDDPATGEGAR